MYSVSDVIRGTRNPRVVAREINRIYHTRGGRVKSKHGSTSLIDVMKHSDANKKDLRETYRENLEIVLDEVEQLLHTFQRKTAVTADHGEILGDRHDYVPIQDCGHHAGIYNDASVKVPWHTYKQGERPNISHATPRKEEINKDKVNNCLQELGYKV